MKNEKIYDDIHRISSVTKTAAAIGCTKQSLRNKLSGVTPWKITELIALSRYFRWTVEEFLDVLGYNETEV